MDKIPCPECGKRFHDNEALEQHRKAKHSEGTVVQKKASKFPMKYAVIAVFLIAVAGFGVYMLTLTPTGYAVATGDGDNFAGAADTPVVITEYSDFQCPFCGRFATETKPQLFSEYVDTGKVKFVYKHLPLDSHPLARKAAEASECAADQSKFWEYHDKIFANQKSLVMPSFKQFAGELGLDQEQFNACLDSGVMGSRVARDKEEALGKGLSSTPTFFVNNVKISGAQPYSVFKQAIDAELAKA